MFEIVAFDADDTLWNNETYYMQARDHFGSICADYVDPQEAVRRLETNEIANLPLFGYGIKSFALSMIETAVGVSERRISAEKIDEILSIARKMLQTGIEPLEGVEETLAILSHRYRLMLITKGDPSEQGSKINRSGLAKYFNHIEITSEKSIETYRVILGKYQVQPERFLMVGNSLKSDILPVIKIGGQAIYIPHMHTWSFEVAEEDPDLDVHSLQIEQFDQVPSKIEELANH